jgi:hypothetical protein
MLNGCCTNAERLAIPIPLLWRNCRTEEFVLQMMEAFTNEKPLHRKYALKILCGMSELLQTLPSLVDVPIAAGGKITVCGDTHGQCHIVHNVWLLGPRVTFVLLPGPGVGYRPGVGDRVGVGYRGWRRSKAIVISAPHASCIGATFSSERGCCCDLKGLRGCWVHTTDR